MQITKELLTKILENIDLNEIIINIPHIAFNKALMLTAYDRIAFTLNIDTNSPGGFLPYGDSQLTITKLFVSEIPWSKEMKENKSIGSVDLDEECYNMLHVFFINNKPSIDNVRKITSILEEMSLGR